MPFLRYDSTKVYTKRRPVNGAAGAVFLVLLDGSSPEAHLARMVFRVRVTVRVLGLGLGLG